MIDGSLGPLTQLVAQRIKALREELGKSSVALAAEAGLSKGHLSRLERALQSPTVDTIEKIAEVLEVAPLDLLLDPAAGPRERLVARTRTLSPADLQRLWDALPDE